MERLFVDGPLVCLGSGALPAREDPVAGLGADVVDALLDELVLAQKKLDEARLGNALPDRRLVERRIELR